MVTNIGTFNFTDTGRLLVTDTPGLSNITTKHIFGEASIASLSEVTVVTFTVPSGKELRVYSYGFGGQADGVAVLDIDSSSQHKLRNSAAKRSESEHFEVGHIIPASSIVSVKITNKGDNLKSYEAYIHGEIYDI